MARGLSLSPVQRAQVARASRLPLAAQRKIAREFDPDLFGAWQGWTWGRKAFRLRNATIDLPTSDRLVLMFRKVRAIEYIAAKRDPDGRSRFLTYRHAFEGELPDLATELGACPGESISSRGAPKFEGPGVFQLGRLAALEGVTASGNVERWEPPAFLTDWDLVGCPRTQDLHVVRYGRARSFAPIWIMRGSSKYRLTSRGIEG